MTFCMVVENDFGPSQIGPKIFFLGRNPLLKLSDILKLAKCFKICLKFEFLISKSHTTYFDTSAQYIGLNYSINVLQASTSAHVARL